MDVVRTTTVLILAAFATACAGPGRMDAPVPSMSPRVSDARTTAPMTAMETRMKAMKEMHQKMVDANSPAERQALMAEHMKAMQEGMEKLKEMVGGMQRMGSMDHSTGMPAGMAQRHQLMAEQTAMMQLLLEMLAQRMPAPQATQ